MSDFLRGQPNTTLFDLVQQHLTEADAVLGILRERGWTGEPPTPEPQAVVSQALELGVCISFDYPSVVTVNGTETDWTERMVHPSSIDLEHTHPSVLAYDFDRSAPRRFRFDRMRDVELAAPPQRDV